MIFKPKLAQLVVDGQKKVTRRAATIGIDGEVVPCIYEEGRDYAVCPGRGMPSIARIEVTDVRLEQLGDITEEEAALEGGFTRESFFDVWESLTGSVEPTQPVWRIEFELTS